MCSLSPGTIFISYIHNKKFDKYFSDEFKGHLRSLSLFAKFFSSCGFDLHTTVMLL